MCRSWSSSPYWILEIGELAGLRKAEVETLRSFLSRQNDIYRAAFGKRATPHLRQCVFFGTTNAESGYLRDTTGNRRFWPVKTPGGGRKHSWELTEEDICISLFRRGVLQEGIDANGGYLVPEEYDSRLIDGLTEENIMRRLGHRITTSGGHKINIAATKPAAVWIDEGGALTCGDATFSQITLDVHKLHVAVKVTEELLYDNAFGLESYIIAQFAKALGNAEEDAFLNGDGSGKPLGLLAATGGAQTAVTTAGASITADEVIDPVYVLKRPYRKKASFLTNDQTLAFCAS